MVSGLNMYLDKKGRSIYYNFIDKKGYVVEKEQEQKFRLMYYRYSIVVITLILLGDYFKSLQNTLIVGFAAAILIEIYFRFFYLKGLPSQDNFNREKKITRLGQTIKENQKEKAVMRAVAYVLLSVLIMINAIQQNYNEVFIVLSGVVSVYSIYSAAINVVAFVKIKRA